jgi:hypothetical protein
MQLIIPSAALNAGMVVGGFGYVVVNVTGDVTGLFVSKVALGAAVIGGAVAGALVGPVAGTVVASAVKELADGYFVPAVKTGSRLTGLGIAAGAGLATVAIVSLVYVGGHYIVETIRASKKCDVTPIDYSLLTDGDFQVITLESIVDGEGSP